MLKGHRAFVFVRDFVRRLSAHRVDAYSAQAAFFLFLSLFPMAFLLLPLMRFLPASQSLPPTELTDWVPSAVSQLLLTVLRETEEKTTSTLLGVSAFTAFWSAGRGVYALMRGFSGVYSTEERRSYFKLRLLASFYTLLFLAVMLVALGLLVFGNRLYLLFCSFIGSQPISGFWFRLMMGCIVLLLFVLFFWLLYFVMAGRRLPARVLLPGSGISALGWLVFSYLFSVYLEYFADYANLYGSLSAVVVLMLWLYFCMYILFVGAELNCFLAAPILLHADAKKTKRAIDKCTN